MKDTLYMAWRYLTHHKVKTVILVLSIALIIYLPIGLKVVVDQSADSLTARAESTPLIIGVKGSPLELVLNTLRIRDGASGKFLPTNTYVCRDTSATIDKGIGKIQKLNIETSGLSREVIAKELENRGVIEEVLGEYSRILDDSEFSRFAPTSEKSDIDQIYKDAVQLIRNLENSL